MNLTFETRAAFAEQMSDPDTPDIIPSVVIESPADKLVRETILKIRNADSACLIDMHVRNFIHEARLEYLKLDATARDNILEAVRQRFAETDNDPGLHASFKDLWRDWMNPALSGFPHTLDKISGLVAPAGVTPPQVS